MQLCLFVRLAISWLLAHKIHNYKYKWIAFFYSFLTRFFCVLPARTGAVCGCLCDCACSRLQIIIIILNRAVQSAMYAFVYWFFSPTHRSVSCRCRMPQIPFRVPHRRIGLSRWWRPPMKIIIIIIIIIVVWIEFVNIFRLLCGHTNTTRHTHTHSVALRCVITIQFWVGTHFHTFPQLPTRARKIFSVEKEIVPTTSDGFCRSYFK